MLQVKRLDDGHLDDFPKAVFERSLHPLTTAVEAGCKHRADVIADLALTKTETKDDSCGPGLKADKLGHEFRHATDCPGICRSRRMECRKWTFHLAGASGGCVSWAKVLVGCTRILSGSV